MYTTPTFMGALVRSFNTSIGWGMGSTSTLRIELVDDPRQNAYFYVTESMIGQPFYFQYYGFRFNGLLQKYEQRRDTQGNPVYEVNLVDPREILEGAQLITNSYHGSVVGVRNLYNIFGSAESVYGFGGSFVNDGGIPWTIVQSELNRLINTPTLTTYGGPLNFRGVSYGLDLSQMPIPPQHYRVGAGSSIGLLEAIAQVCEDCGCDFFVELVGYTIRIRTVSRASQPPLGTISAIANTNWGNVVSRSTNGLELRNEPTSTFLVGGNQTSLWPTTGLRQFWGNDGRGNPIVGTPFIEDFWGVDEENNPSLLNSIPAEFVNLSALELADIVPFTRNANNEPIYPCSTTEMRCALGNYETWVMYLNSQRPDMAKLIGVNSPYLKFSSASVTRPDGIADNEWEESLKQMQALQQTFYNRVQKMYRFVRGMAENYYGKKYLCPLPFVLRAQDPETLQIRTSWEIADGAFVQDGQSLGISTLNEDMLKTDDGRFKAFCFYPASTLLAADINTLGYDAILEPNGLYAEISVDQRVIYAGSPYALATINKPVLDKQADRFGNFEVLASIFGATTDEARKKLKDSPSPIRVAPAPVPPTIAMIPLRSNILTYGPWYATTAKPGKVRFEQDQTLTPWGYGTYAMMNYAAQAKIISSITNMQVGEVGTLELAGPPANSIGDTLQGNGPNITNIDVSVGTNGITTSYRFQTFTPKFGLMARSTSERLKRLTMSSIETQKNLRASLRRQAVVKSQTNTANIAAKALNENPGFLRTETPSDILHSVTKIGPDGVKRHYVATSKMEEALGYSNANNEDYKNTVLMSWSGLFRAFDSNHASDSILPKFNVARTYTVDNESLHCGTLDPWGAANDIDVWSWGESYEGVNAYRHNGEFSSARAFGHRAPLVLVGWGMSIEGTIVPAVNPRKNSGEWKAGPLDCLWDESRGVWTVHDCLKGVVDNDIPPGSSGPVTIYNGPVSSFQEITAKNWSDYITYASGTRVLLNYVATDNAWYVTTDVDGLGGGSSSSVTQQAILSKGSQAGSGCLYEATVMNFNHTNDEVCCYESGIPVYMTLLDSGYSGSYLPGFYSGRSYNNKPIYIATNNGPASLVLCDGSSGGGGGEPVGEWSCPGDPPASVTLSLDRTTPITMTYNSELVAWTWSGSDPSPCADGTLTLLLYVSGDAAILNWVSNTLETNFVFNPFSCSPFSSSITSATPTITCDGGDMYGWFSE